MSKYEEGGKGANTSGPLSGSPRQTSPERPGAEHGQVPKAPPQPEVAAVDRTALLRHRRRLASALYTVYFHTEGGRRPRGSKLSSLEAANAVLAADRSDPEQRLAQNLYWALGDARQYFKDRPKNRRGQKPTIAEFGAAGTGVHKLTVDGYLGRADARLGGDGLRGDRFFPYVLAVSEASNDPATNETTARAVLLVNMSSLDGKAKLDHVARAVDPRAWIETGFFADIYRVDWDERGLPSYDGNGIPLRNEDRDERVALGKLHRVPNNRPGLLESTFDDLVFENFDLQSIQGESLSAFRNLLAIRCPEVTEDDASKAAYVLEFKLFRCLSSRLQGLTRSGGMDKNEGRITAQTLAAFAGREEAGSKTALDVLIDRWVADVGGEKGLTALKDADRGASLREKLMGLLKQLGLDGSLLDSSPAQLREQVAQLMIIEAEKTVHFTDLTPQGEPFIDVGELLNYAAPLLLKPFFEQLLILGVCARPDRGLRQLVRCRVKA